VEAAYQSCEQQKHIECQKTEIMSWWDEKRCEKLRQPKSAVHRPAEPYGQRINVTTVTALGHSRTDAPSNFKRGIAGTLLAVSGNGSLMDARKGTL
jgi:hypothetical protein